MRRSILLILALLTLTGCQTNSPDRHLHAGMTREELRADFGEPSRIEPDAPEGEDWYYLIRTWSKPAWGGATSKDDITQVGSVDFTLSRSWTTEQRPVHLSKDGHVIDPVPIGKVVSPHPRTDSPDHDHLPAK